LNQCVPELGDEVSVIARYAQKLLLHLSSHAKEAGLWAGSHICIEWVMERVEPSSKSRDLSLVCGPTILLVSPHEQQSTNSTMHKLVTDIELHEKDLKEKDKEHQEKNKDLLNSFQ